LSACTSALTCEFHVNECVIDEHRVSNSRSRLISHGEEEARDDHCSHRILNGRLRGKRTWEGSYGPPGLQH